MQTSSQPKLLPVPFANGGSKQDIPNDSQIGITAGRASYTDGFPPLTRTPLAAGGVPPFGTDFNGVLNDITAAIRWSQAGAGYPFDATFNTAITGYPKGARILNSTFDGFWLNTTDGNSTNPENTTSALTGWVPAGFYGVTALTGLSGSSVTLTTLQAGRDRITLSGALTANINLIVPAWSKRWAVVNNCTGNYSVTVKTLSGTGVAIPTGITANLYGDGVNVTQDTKILNVNIKPANISTFTSNGSFTVPAGITTLYLSGCGGGGGGGGGGCTTTTSNFGGGGGGGSAGKPAIKQTVSVTPGQVIPVTIGAGGSAGTSAANTSGTTGGAGGSTIFGSLLTLAGGAGGAGGGGASLNGGGIGGSGYPNGGYGTDGNGLGTGNGGPGASGPFGGGGAAGRSSSGGSAAGLAGLAGYGNGVGGGGGSTGVNGTGGVGMSGILIVEW